MGIMKKIYIIGAGGHAKVIADIVLKRKELLSEKLELMGFFDDKEDKSELIFGKPILGNIDEIEKITQNKEIYFIIGIGNNKIRKLIFEKYKLNYYTAIHPNSIIGNEVKLGIGTVVMAGAIINSYTIIGEHSIFNTGAVIDHECNIGSYSHICPRVAIAGNVAVGQETWVGIGSIVKQGIIIGNKVMIGAGSLVLKNIEDKKLAYGHPCVEIGENNV